MRPICPVGDPFLLRARLNLGLGNEPKPNTGSAQLKTKVVALLNALRMFFADAVIE